MSKHSFIGGDNSGVLNFGSVGDSIINVSGDGNVVNAEASQKAEALIKSIRGNLKHFPANQREDAEEDLEHLEKELDKSLEKQRPRQIKRYIRSLLAACGAAVAFVVPGLEQSSEMVTFLKAMSAESVEIVENYQALQQVFKRVEDNPEVIEILSTRGSYPMFKSILEASEQVHEIGRASCRERVSFTV